jgi:hypothetical protein
VSSAANEVVVMSLSPHEQQELKSIEDRLSGSDPKLASLLATFTRLTAGETMPAHGFTRGGRGSRESPLRGSTCPSASRPWHHMTWRGAGLVLMVLLALALLAGAMALSVVRVRACPVPGAACAGQLPVHAAWPAVPVAVMLGRSGVWPESSRRRRET